MRSISKATLFLLLFILAALVSENVFSAEEIGRVIRMSGISSARSVSGETLSISIASPVAAGQSIICSSGSTVDILLSEGTSLKIYGPAGVTVDSCKIKPGGMPTTIRLLYGKIKVASKCVENSLSLKIITPSAEISAVMAEIGIIASMDDTCAALYRYKAAVASTDIKVSKAYMLYPGEEIRVKSGKIPEPPEAITVSGLAWWIEKYHLTENKSKIRAYELDEGPADWIIRRRDD